MATRQQATWGKYLWAASPSVITLFENVIVRPPITPWLAQLPVTTVTTWTDQLPD